LRVVIQFHILLLRVGVLADIQLMQAVVEEVLVVY
jgi:hypothetical protein